MEFNVKILTSRSNALDNARATVKKNDLAKEPSEDFWNKILLAEHSPIRSVCYQVDMLGIPSWVSVHFTRHKFGVEHYVSTQRSDRVGEDREGKAQNEPVNHRMFLNAQTFINISRKRLCNQASQETRSAWERVISELSKIDEVLASKCVRECVYRGFCPEIEFCGFTESIGYIDILNNYRYL